MDRSSKQKINKESQVLNDTLDEVDLIDIFRTSHPNAEEWIHLFSSARGTFSWTDHILGHESNLSKFKKIEILSSIFSNHYTETRYQWQQQQQQQTLRNTHMETKQHVSK